MISGCRKHFGKQTAVSSQTDVRVYSSNLNFLRVIPVVCNTENIKITILPIVLLDVELCLPFSEKKTHTGRGREREKKEKYSKNVHKVKDWSIIYDETIHNL
jgi:hypothetical protein